jgi:hypothetical protein
MILTLFDLFKIQLPCFTCGYDSKLYVHAVKDESTINFGCELKNGILWLSTCSYDLRRVFTIDVKNHEIYPKVTNLNKCQINFTIQCLDCLTDFHCFATVKDNILSALQVTDYCLFYPKFHVLAYPPMEEIEIKRIGVRQATQPESMKVPPFKLNSFLNKEVESIVNTYDIFS